MVINRLLNFELLLTTWLVDLLNTVYRYNHMLFFRFNKKYFQDNQHFKMQTSKPLTRSQRKPQTQSPGEQIKQSAMLPNANTLIVRCLALANHTMPVSATPRRAGRFPVCC